MPKTKAEKPKVHYTALNDPERFLKVTVPAFFKAVEVAKQINYNKIV